MKKSMRIILSFLLFPLFAYADDYKILYINSPTIKIGDQICKTGDVFSDHDVIFWTKEKQAFKAQNTMSKTIRLFTEPDFRVNGSKSVKDYFLRKGNLSTRGALSLSELETYLSDDFFLLDSICIESTEMTDSLHYFLISYEHDTQTVHRRVESNSGEIVIDRSMFPESSSEMEFVLTISYVNKRIEEEYQLTNSMRIVLLPLTITE